MMDFLSEYSLQDLLVIKMVAITNMAQSILDTIIVFDNGPYLQLNLRFVHTDILSYQINSLLWKANKICTYIGILYEYYTAL